MCTKDQLASMASKNWNPWTPHLSEHDEKAKWYVAFQTSPSAAGKPAHARSKNQNVDHIRQWICRRLCVLPGHQGASRRRMSPLEKHLSPVKERSLLTVRMREQRPPPSCRWRWDVAIGSATPSSPLRPPPWAPPLAAYAWAAWGCWRPLSPKISRQLLQLFLTFHHQT